MKQTPLHIILSLCFSVLFFMFGTGYNLVTYCCSDCKKTGIEMVSSLSHTCSDKRHCEQEMSFAGEQQDNQSACEAIHHSKSCNFKRLTVETPVCPINHLHLERIKTVFFTLFIPASYSYQDLIHSPQRYYPPPDFYCLFLTGRTVLVQKSVLII
ncbi:MAG: hypothetical protein QM751_13165 [Paludibacteraceae bacterium]